MQSSKPKKIQIIFVNYSFNIGGAETLIFELCKGLDRDKYSVSVACLSGGGALEEEFKKAGIPVYVVEKSEGVDFLLPFKFIALFNRLKVDIVNTHGAGNWLFAGLAARFCGKKLVHTEHTKPYHNLNRWKKIEKFMSYLTHQIIAVGDSVADFMVKEEGISSKKIRVIHNGIRAEVYSSEIDRMEKRREIGVGTSDLVIGNVARLFPNKDQKTLIEAFAKVSDKMPNAKLVIVGDGPLKDSLLSMVSGKKLEGKVVFLGSRRDIPEILKSFDMFALSSVLEGFPIALLEAMASGLPAVVTDVDGNSEVITNEKTGLLVPPGKPDALAESMLRLLNDKNMLAKIGKNAKELIEHDFSFKKTVKEYEELFTSF